MYASMQLYFANGGGPCFLISIGDYTVSSSDLYTQLKGGLDALAAEDEPTLIVFPDAYELSDLTIYNDALAQCHRLQDRFLIMDVKTSGDTEADASTFVMQSPVSMYNMEQRTIRCKHKPSILI